MNLSPSVHESIQRVLRQTQLLIVALDRLDRIPCVSSNVSSHLFRETYRDRRDQSSQYEVKLQIVPGSYTSNPAPVLTFSLSYYSERSSSTPVRCMFSVLDPPSQILQSLENQLVLWAATVPARSARSILAAARRVCRRAERLLNIYLRKSREYRRNWREFHARSARDKQLERLALMGSLILPEAKRLHPDLQPVYYATVFLYHQILGYVHERGVSLECMWERRSGASLCYRYHSFIPSGKHIVYCFGSGIVYNGQYEPVESVSQCLDSTVEPIDPWLSALVLRQSELFDFNPLLLWNRYREALRIWKRIRQRRRTHVATGVRSG